MDSRLLDVDHHGVLKPPASFWWGVVFLGWHWLLLLAAGLSGFVGAGTVSWIYDAVSWPVLVAELPMLALVFAAWRRVPDAGALPRRLWARGRELFSLTAALRLAWAVWVLAVADDWRPWPERMIALLAIVDLGILIGVWRSPLYRTLFGEFPPPSAS
ncbi:DUF2919 family protein [Piscinibacter sakaiensis]|uniref:Transmembrane protein n=1 Tax=Piscinibacter sakaiensis TaxID=1547922 RepID=A0A0K8P1M4_PISS1|nr:DUF2919 family protein [Piscinibacter sakaiensis]GAP36439.1 hypothetical protein ISF6_2279 [Piscinibacter sakaiensis]